MKKLLTIAFLVIGMITNAQGIKFVDEEFVTTSITIDPVASIKEKGLNAAVELELVSNWKSVKLNIQEFTALEGGYIDLVGGAGINLTSGYFNKWRAYAGTRFGFINRSKYTYPLLGLEGTLDIKIAGNLYLRYRVTWDKRGDGRFSGVPDFWRLSNFGGVLIRVN